MRTLVIAAAALALGAAPALAQSGSSAGPGMTTGQGSSGGQAGQGGATNRSGGSGMAMRTRLRQDLAKAGFTNISVMPEAFAVHATNSQGQRVFMLISPDSVTEITPVSGAQSGAGAARSGTMSGGTNSGSGNSGTTKE